VVSGRSMEPSLRPGHVFLFRKCGPDERAWHAGDVVLLHREGETWIKRIYATAGTRFWVMRDQDGERSYCRPIREGQQARFERMARFLRAQGRKCEVIRMQVPAGKLFVMGDAQCSRDSRELGPVLESEVVGRVITALPGGLPGTPECVELAFPSRTTFVRFGAAVPPSVSKRDARRQRAVDAQRAEIRARSLGGPGTPISSAA